MADRAYKQTTNFPALTSIRFFFSILVFFSHFYGYHPEIFPEWIERIGGMAVSWFFILSGFILCHNYQKLNNMMECIRFIVLRFFRLFPVQLFTIALSIAIFPSGWQIVEQYQVYTIQALTLTQSWSAIPFASQVFNAPAWSISVEWFFYLFFPFLLKFPTFINISIGIAGVAIAIYSMSSMNCFIDWAHFVRAGDSFHTTCLSLFIVWPPMRLIEFITGICAYEIYAKIRNSYKEGIWITLFLFLAFGFSAVYFDMSAKIMTNRIYGIMADRVVVVIIGFNMILGLALPGLMAKLLSIRFLIFLGEISFSIYMTHGIVLREITSSTFMQSISPGMQLLIAISFTCVLSSTLFLALETPSRRIVRRLLSKL